MDDESKVERSLKLQLVVTTILMTPVIYVLAHTYLPATFSFPGLENPIVTNLDAFICAATGLWSGLIIGYFTEVFTSNQYSPV
jgi:Na+/H+-translocating membrane pyrophosphatase